MEALQTAQRQSRQEPKAAGSWELGTTPAPIYFASAKAWESDAAAAPHQGLGSMKKQNLNLLVKGDEGAPTQEQNSLSSFLPFP